VKLALEPEEQRLQERVRAFLAEHCPDPDELPTSSTSASTS
jgi:hypothetical protein